MECEACGEPAVREVESDWWKAPGITGKVWLCERCAACSVDAAVWGIRTRRAATAVVCDACGVENPEYTNADYRFYGLGRINFCDGCGTGRTCEELANFIKERRARTKGKMAAKTTTLGWSEIEKVLDSGAANRVLLYGPPGTGKSHAGVTRKVTSNEVKTFSITLTPEMSAAELRGHFVPKGDRFVWIDGPGVAAWRCGGRLVLNEIDQASSDVMTLLHVILDDPDFARLTLPNEELEEVRPKEGFTVVATTNAENPQAVLPAALYDRFPVQIKVTEPNPAAIATLPKDLQAAATELAAHKDPARRIGLRSWQAFAKLRENLGAEMAAKAVFGPRAFDVVNGLALGKK